MHLDAAIAEQKSKGGGKGEGPVKALVEAKTKLCDAAIKVVYRHGQSERDDVISLTPYISVISYTKHVSETFEDNHSINMNLWHHQYDKCVVEKETDKSRTFCGVLQSLWHAG